ncbi:beta-glucosidase [Phototrophicus methaneseepsis]|uniref:Beta-glucosidase n=1 Tax=Phototrophicus methaneseepsis TaxID=2710758 RepID=A0A7S8ICV1_9CHLR|nr:GH1 family beta-glucosidase [Phototrophicus methaneseepsis]QPC80907.1 beta-glucosidase [Phototrophicus methaneseepsis]
MAFPDNFVWGAAAASYQIEGAAFADEKGLSVWDVFSHTPGKTWNGDTGDVACDHYNRYQEDVQVMKQIGLQAYRLSISWPRILPEGVGKVNEAGLGFYDKLVDELLEADITPYVTLFHWDYPWELYCRGGWLNRDSADWFADYTDIVVRALGDRVKHWMTLNEPPVFVLVGHQAGRHAPGDQFSDRHIARIIHHVLLTHGKSVQAIRAASPQPAQISWALNTDPSIPVVEDETHINAARETYWGLSNGFWNAGLWLDPVLRGEYPQAALDRWGEYLPIREGDLEEMNQPLDFVGLNIYRGHYVAVEEDGGSNIRSDGRPELEGFEEGYPLTMMDWPVTPEALYWGAKWVNERYGLPIAITENGLASMDWVAVDGAVHDPNRIDFLKRYLRGFGKAGADGIPLHAYFQWSIFDNYEWAEGYRKRFGLVHVNYQTQERILKDSAHWYRQVIESNGAILDE